MKLVTYQGQTYEEKPQLLMRWPSSKLSDRVEPNTCDDYTVRGYHEGDESSFLELVGFGDFDPWDDEKLRYNLGQTIPGGFFLATENSTGRPVATILCLHNYSGRIPFCGEIGWTVCHPEHRGKSLGYSIGAHATNRFLDAGYSDIRLRTEYYRLAAIKTYLQLGYVPILDCDETVPMWRDICESLSWEFTPDDFPRK